ncbi:MAG: 16S rRNA (adenine(1518)-N(6)/adenine(1519)-N(6))-dimethyltransferase RsmA [Candidatus Magasanikbacteria bacterium]|nr:16S rRNA (adenine(1518)-N(6)/adenine(1519)-N(6))-dimethyltransferase RsmA [Candidatus Magasanikbacteria bacterium]
MHNQRKNKTPQADKSLGQNFLVDKNILARIVAEGEITDKDYILEVGAGAGVLTAELVKLAKQVLSLEIDERLIFLLQNKFSQQKNLEVRKESVLVFDLNNLVGIPYKVIANIPYYLTSRILEKFLMASHKPQLMVLLVQREVAERICASDDKKSFLSVMVQYYGTPQIVQIVKPNAFVPPPKVESAILKISNISSRLSLEQEKFFFKVVKTGFVQKRKMLKKNLKSLFSPELISSAFLGVNLDSEVRAEDLSVSDWIKLAEKLA